MLAIGGWISVAPHQVTHQVNCVTASRPLIWVIAHLLLLALPSAAFSDEAFSAVDLTPRPVPRLRPGIVIGQEKAAGYSNLITVVLPRLSQGHVDSLPEFARRYASMFKFAVLANVTRQESNVGPSHVLEKVGIGFAMDIGGKLTVVTRDTANQLGANLGMIDRGVLGGNEDCLDEIVQIVRTDRLIIFDAKANMLIGNAHQERYIRHLIWTSKETGELGFLVWQLNDAGNHRYSLDHATMQLLPNRFREDRQIHVSSGGLLSSVPTPDRFAMVHIPQGTAVPISARLKTVAGRKTMNRADLDQLVAGVAESLGQISTQSSGGQP